jgi:hypothetical protein
MDSNNMTEIKKDFANYLTENKDAMDQMHKDIQTFLNCNSALIAKFGFDAMLSYACDQAIKKHLKLN